ncbi:cupredoxin domain-containing protein [bacterium]|nr:cupredoxin domain-containing protein [bacterium]
MFRTEEFLTAQTAVRTYIVNNCSTDERVNLHATEYTFDGLPAAVTGRRVQFEMDNDGKGVHEMVLLRLSESEDRTPKEIFADPADPDVLWIGRAAANSGDSVSMVVDLEAGKYSFVCFVADAPGQEGHLFKGMFTEFVVE